MAKGGFLACATCYLGFWGCLWVFEYFELCDLRGPRCSSFFARCFWLRQAADAAFRVNFLFSVFGV